MYNWLYDALGDYCTRMKEIARIAKLEQTRQQEPWQRAIWRYDTMTWPSVTGLVG
jgi:hypothetical protein